MPKEAATLLFVDVELARNLIGEDLYVLTINYRPNSKPSLLKKVLFCNSKLHFNPALKMALNKIESKSMQLNIKYTHNQTTGVITFQRQ